MHSVTFSDSVFSHAVHPHFTEHAESML